MSLVSGNNIKFEYLHEVIAEIRKLANSPEIDKRLVARYDEVLTELWLQNKSKLQCIKNRYAKYEEEYELQGQMILSAKSLLADYKVP